MTSSCLYTLGEEELAFRERNKPQDQDFTFLGEKYHIPAGELKNRIVPLDSSADGADTQVDRASIKLPYIFGKLRVFDPNVEAPKFSYSDLSNTTDPYEQYEDIVDYNSNFLFAPRFRSKGANGVFISRENMFAGQRVVLRCYESGLVSSCTLQTYLPLNGTVGQLIKVEQGNVNFRMSNKTPCKKKRKAKQFRQERKGRYYSCFYIDDVLEYLPSALADVEESLLRWRENTKSLP